METNIDTGIRDIIEAARGERKAEVVDLITSVDVEGLPSLPMLAVPIAGGGVRMESVRAEVDAWRATWATRPVRRQGTATLLELASFIDHTNRFKDEDSAVFVSGGADEPVFTSVLDYHERVNGRAPNPDELLANPLPRFGKHRGSYTPEFSPEWEAWKAADGAPMTQPVFAALITDHVRDIIDVGGAADLGELAGWFATKHGRKVPPTEFYADSGRMLDIAEGLTISMAERVTDVAKRDTGETSISFEAKAETSVAGLKVTVPVAFVIELPLFVGGARYQLPVRLRLTTYQDGDTKRAKWTIAIFGGDESVLTAVADMRAEVAAKTGLPVFAGSPE